MAQSTERLARLLTATFVLDPHCPPKEAEALLLAEAGSPAFPHSLLDVISLASDSQLQKAAVLRLNSYLNRHGNSQSPEFRAQSTDAIIRLLCSQHMSFGVKKLLLEGLRSVLVMDIQGRSRKKILLLADEVKRGQLQEVQGRQGVHLAVSALLSRCGTTAKPIIRTALDTCAREFSTLAQDWSEPLCLSVTHCLKEAIGKVQVLNFRETAVSLLFESDLPSNAASLYQQQLLNQLLQVCTQLLKLHTHFRFQRQEQICRLFGPLFNRVVQGIDYSHIHKQVLSFLGACFRSRALYFEVHPASLPLVEGLLCKCLAYDSDRLARVQSQPEVFTRQDNIFNSEQSPQSLIELICEQMDGTICHVAGRALAIAEAACAGAPDQGLLESALCLLNLVEHVIAKRQDSKAYFQRVQTLLHQLLPRLGTSRLSFGSEVRLVQLSCMYSDRIYVSTTDCPPLDHLFNVLRSESKIRLLVVELLSNWFSNPDLADTFAVHVDWSLSQLIELFHLGQHPSLFTLAKDVLRVHQGQLAMGRTVSSLIRVTSALILEGQKAKSEKVNFLFNILLQCASLRQIAAVCSQDLLQSGHLLFSALYNSPHVQTLAEFICLLLEQAKQTLPLFVQAIESLPAVVQANKCRFVGFFRFICLFLKYKSFALTPEHSRGLVLASCRVAVQQDPRTAVEGLLVLHVLLGLGQMPTDCFQQTLTLVRTLKGEDGQLLRESVYWNKLLGVVLLLLWRAPGMITVPEVQTFYRQSAGEISMYNDHYESKVAFLSALAVVSFAPPQLYRLLSKSLMLSTIILQQRQDQTAQVEEEDQEVDQEHRLRREFWDCLQRVDQFQPLRGLLAEESSFRSQLQPEEQSWLEAGLSLRRVRTPRGYQLRRIVSIK